MSSGLTQRTPDADPIQIGFIRAGSDNKQFALNIMRWLEGVLEPVGGPSSPAD